MLIHFDNQMVSESAYRYNFAKPYFTVTLYGTLTKQNLKQVDKFVCCKEHNNTKFSIFDIHFLSCMIRR